MARQLDASGLVAANQLVVCLRNDNGEDVTVPKDALLPRELEALPARGLPDVIQLGAVHEPGILANLERRFAHSTASAGKLRAEASPASPRSSQWEALLQKSEALEAAAGDVLGEEDGSARGGTPGAVNDDSDDDCVYTACGRVCIAVNPFQAHWTRPQMDAAMLRYGRPTEAFGRETPAAPHVFAVARAALAAALRQERGSAVSIVFMGERGTGKSVNAAHALRYLAHAASAADAAALGADTRRALTCGSTLLATLTRARRLGAAASSRCTASTTLYYRAGGELCGARLEVACLESSRACAPPTAPAESNFHALQHVPRAHWPRILTCRCSRRTHCTGFGPMPVSRTAFSSLTESNALLLVRIRVPRSIVIAGC